MKILLMTAVLFTFAIIGCKKSSAPGLPSVSSTNPIDNGTNITRSQQIVFTFNQPMDSSTINSSTFYVMQGSTLVPGTITYSGTTATFTPTTTLAAGTKYTVTLTTGVKSKAGVALTSNTVRNFTTGGTTSTLAVVNLGAAGNYVIVAQTEIKNAPTSFCRGLAAARA